MYTTRAHYKKIEKSFNNLHDYIEGKIHQGKICQDKSFLLEQTSELKKRDRAIAASCEETAIQSKTLFENRRSTISRQRNFQ